MSLETKKSCHKDFFFFFHKTVVPQRKAHSSLTRSQCKNFEIEFVHSEQAGSLKKYKSGLILEVH